MPKKALASLNVVINAVTAPLFRGLNKASKRLVAFGGKMQAVGRSISMSFSLPFAAVGVAGAKMAIDFEKNMTKIKTLVGISGKEVNEFSKQVMGLSGATAQAPAELAEGLFFLTSAGLRGANAMETLESVSKGVAIGLGEQADLAKVAAAAQNAYGSDTISAAKALDIFGGAVREGMFEASDLAEVLGTQLGMAAELGISFEEVNAFIATYTKTTGDAKAATTSFGGIMMALAKITPKQARALDEIGMSADSLQIMLGEEGLRATLMHLQSEFEAQGVPMSEFFSKAQALKGVFGVLGEQTETYGNVLEGMSGSIGMVDKGFNDLEQTTGFKMQSAFNNLKNATQELGVIMMPIFTQIVEGAVKIARGFTSLDTGTKQIILAAGTLVAFSGPLMTMSGAVVKALGMMTGPVGVVIAAIGLLFALIYDNWEEVRPIFVKFINYWIDLYNESEAFRIVVNAIGVAFKGVWATIKLLFKGTLQQIDNFINYAAPTFDGLGKIIAGAFSLDPDLIAEGWSQMIDNGHSMLREGMSELEDEWSDTMNDAFATMHANVKTKDKIELVTEEQVDQAIADLEGYLSEKAKGVRDKIKELMGGGTFLATTESEGEVSGGVAAGGGGGATGDPTEGLKASWEDFFSWGDSAMGNWVDDIGNKFQDIQAIAGEVINGISALWSAQHEKAMTELNNEFTVRYDTLEATKANEKAAIENSLMTEEQKKSSMIALEKKYNDDKKKLDKEMEAKEKEILKRQAKRQKMLNIVAAIMNTAQGITAALALGPVGIPLSIIIAALGAAQIATIASTPLPLAEGGLAYGPTNAIVGDNPGAANDPEVIAPLSKLKQMLHREMNLEVNVGGMLKGNDIYLSNEETADQRPRYV